MFTLTPVQTIAGIDYDDIRNKMAEETIYLCNFRVSVDGDWLCLRELTDVSLSLPGIPRPEPEEEDG